jgi:dolichyl-phosphate-mannose--protein O-mannosyl transferase
MESKAYLVKGIKNKEKFKQEFLEKIKAMVSTNAVLNGNIITVTGNGSWAESSATLTFAQKGQDIEVMAFTNHSASHRAFLFACVLLFFGLVLVAIPWILYDDETKKFDQNLTNACNYFFFQ